jgi:hypothetical protein
MVARPRFVRIRYLGNFSIAGYAARGYERAASARCHSQGNRGDPLKSGGRRRPQLLDTSRVARLRKLRNGRQANWRNRQKARKIVLPVEVSELPLASALIRSGFLSDAQTADREAVGRCVAEIIGEWCRLWV